MPLPLLATLSARARRAFPIIQRGVREGFTSREIARTLATADLGIRRQSLLDIMRAERGVQQSGAELRFLNRNATPDPRRLPEAPYQIGRAFSFKVRLRGVDTSTGEAMERHVTVLLNRPASRGEIEQLAFNWAQPEPEQYGIALTEVMLESGMQSGPRGTVM